MTNQGRALTEAEAALRLGIAAATLRNWRRANAGPVFRRFGRSVRYLEEDLARYINGSRNRPKGTGSTKGQ